MEFVCLPLWFTEACLIFHGVNFNVLKSKRNFHSMIWKAMIFCLVSFVIEATFAYFEKLEKRPVCTKCTHPSKFWSTKRRKQGLPNYWCPSRVCKSFVANGHQIISINRSKRQILIHYKLFWNVFYSLYVVKGCSNSCTFATFFTQLHLSKMFLVDKGQTDFSLY